MTLDVGDKVIYDTKVTDGKCITGKIAVIWKNRRDIITSYFAILDTGFMVQFRPHNLYWHKLEN